MMQSKTQSMNHSIKQSFAQSINEAMTPSTKATTQQSVNQSIRQINESAIIPPPKSATRSMMHQWNNDPVNECMGQWGTQSTSGSLKPSKLRPVCHSRNPGIYLPIAGSRIQAISRIELCLIAPGNYPRIGYEDPRID